MAVSQGELCPFKGDCRRSSRTASSDVTHHTHAALPPNNPRLLTETALTNVRACGSANDKLGAGAQFLKAIWDKIQVIRYPGMVSTGVKRTSGSLNADLEAAEGLTDCAPFALPLKALLSLLLQPHAPFAGAFADFLLTPPNAPPQSPPRAPLLSSPLRVREPLARSSAPCGDPTPSSNGLP